MPTEYPSATPAVNERLMAYEAVSHHRKSYRRKYRKIMVKFEDKMRESTTLFKDEQRIFGVAQRLAEQTDQILQMLLEINSKPQVPGHFRYDLDTRSSEDTFEERLDEQAILQTLRLARQKVEQGELSAASYGMMVKDVSETDGFGPGKTYRGVIRDGQHLPKVENPTDPIASPAGGFLTAHHEELYLQSLDAYIEGKSTVPRSHAANAFGNKNVDRVTKLDREFQLRSPVSVYNWLRKHQPQVFLQDAEDEKPKPAPRSSKRAAAHRETKQEREQPAGSSTLVHTIPPSKGKRKRQRIMTRCGDYITVNRKRKQPDFDDECSS